MYSLNIQKKLLGKLSNHTLKQKKNWDYGCTHMSQARAPWHPPPSHLDHLSKHLLKAAQQIHMGAH